jgi:transposase
MIEPLLPLKAKEGKPRFDDRTVVNGMLYVLVTGCRWVDLVIPPLDPNHKKDKAKT